MNIFQLTGLLFAIAGTVWCARWGFTHHGWLGAVVGVPLGSFAGAIAGIASVTIVFLIACSLERSRHHRGLRAAFGRYWARDRAAAWRELKDSLRPGDSVSGKVVASFYHGVFIDIGRAFPARLGVVWARGGVDGPRPAIGETVEGRVMDFALGDRVVELTQLEAPPR